MYKENIKLLAKKLDNVHIPDEFKFNEGNFEIDTMELYEELFDYSYEIQNDLPLVSNFNVFIKNKNKVMEFLLKNIKDRYIGAICLVCYEFCFAISNDLDLNT